MANTQDDHMLLVNGKKPPPARKKPLPEIPVTPNFPRPFAPQKHAQEKHTMTDFFSHTLERMKHMHKNSAKSGAKQALANTLLDTLTSYAEDRMPFLFRGLVKTPWFRPVLGLAVGTAAVIVSAMESLPQGTRRKANMVAEAMLTVSYTGGFQTGIQTVMDFVEDKVGLGGFFGAWEQAGKEQEEPEDKWTRAMSAADGDPDANMSTDVPAPPAAPKQPRTKNNG